MMQKVLSSEIAEKIQNEMTYPGQVKITVIREIRSVAYAKQSFHNKQKALLLWGAFFDLPLLIVDSILCAFKGLITKQCIKNVIIQKQLVQNVLVHHLFRKQYKSLVYFLCIFYRLFR